MNKIDEILTKGVDKIYPSKKALEQRMKENKPMRVYLGVDPTGVRLHLGHSIALSKLQSFADAGHEAILLFGTGTVLVGDPSQRGSARKKITQEEINKNISDWKNQVSSIINFDKVKIVQNGDWLLKLGVKEIAEIGSHISATQLFKRESFQRRIDAGNVVWYHETMYPLLQGYDSVAMDVDLEIGGTDQMFNMLIGRELQRKINNREKYVLTNKMIVGTDGQNMSKSTGNCVWLNDSPEDMYGKIMSIPDETMPSYYDLLTNISFEEVSKKQSDPMKLKKQLARIIVAQFHNDKEADSAQEYFEKTVQKKGVSSNVKSVAVKSKQSIIEFLTSNDLAPTRSEAKRLVKQGAVDIDGKTIKDTAFQIPEKDGTIIRVGKRKIVRISNQSD